MEVITIGNNKGGVGKTMQCYQLACHLANKGNKVLVIDLDSQANLSSTFGIQIQRTLVPEWLIGDVGIEDVIVKPEMSGKLYKNIKIIPASRHLANLSKLLILSEGEIRKEAGRKERLLRKRLQDANLDFDYVVIDTPPMLGDELIMSLVASNRVLIPTQELMDTFEIIKETENPGLEFSIIPSMVNPRRKIEKVRMEELSQSFHITPMVRNMVQLQESISMRRPVCIMGAKSAGRRDYEELWKSLNL